MYLEGKCKFNSEFENCKRIHPNLRVLIKERKTLEDDPDEEQIIAQHYLPTQWFVSIIFISWFL